MTLQARSGGDGGPMGGYELIASVAASPHGPLTAGRHASGALALVRRLPDEPTTQAAARAAATIEVDHPAVVAILEVLDGERAVVSAFALGLPLSLVLRVLMAQRKAPAPSLAAAWLVQLLEGLDALQATSGYEPGRLSADNVILAADGDALLFEAQLAAAFDVSEVVAQKPERRGYRAPETLTTSSADGRADQFSLGIMLWELLHRRRAFPGLDAGTIDQQIRRGPPSIDGEIPPPLRAVLARALATEPEERFDTPEAMAAALRQTCGPLPSREERARFFTDLLGTHPSFARLRKKTASGSSAGASTAPPAKSEPPEPRRMAPTPGRRPLPIPPRSKAPPDGHASKPPTPKAHPSKPPTPKVPRAPRPGQPEDRSPVDGATSPPVDERSETGAHDGAAARDETSPPIVAVPEADPGETATRRPPPGAPPPAKERRDSRHPADSNPPPSLRGGPLRQVGRCELFAEIAHGGMATVYLGRWLGAGGFAKTVAVKALHRQYARDPEFVRMFLDEARVVARVRHPNVMPTIDLVEDEGELFIVMDFVQGTTLAHLLRQMKRRRERMPIGIALRIITGVLQGLHAAHEATNERGEPMEIIHRDISPENVMVGIDGYARLIDFGIASALGRATTTKENQVKGKPSYLSPEQVLGDPLDRRTDVYSAAVVLWEALTGRRLFKGDNLGALTFQIVHGEVEAPSARRKDVSAAIDGVVMRGLARDRAERWASAEDMAEELERIGGQASLREVGAWVREVAAERLERAERTLQAVEAAPLAIDDDDLAGPLEVRPAPSAPIRAPLDTVAEDSSDESGASTSLDESAASVLIERSSSDPLSAATPRRRVPWLVVGAATAATALALIALASSKSGPAATPSDGPAARAPEGASSPDGSLDPARGDTGADDEPAALPAPPTSEPASGGAPPVASTSAPPVAPPAPANWPPKPRPRPKPNPRLPDDI